MAEAIAREIAADVMEAMSAGLTPLGFVADLTKQTLVENGFPAEGLESKPILQAAWGKADHVINMSGRPRELAFQQFDKVEDWDVEDPYGENAEIYQRIFEEIERRVEELAERLRQKNSHRGAEE